MATISVLQAAGLYTSPNPFSAVPPGSLSQADNVVINYAGVIESRRGFGHQGYTYGSDPAQRAATIAFYLGQPLITYGNVLAYDTGTAYNEYIGEFNPLDATSQRMKFAQASSAMFFTTATGVKMLDDPAAADAVDAGVPPGVPLARPSQPTYTQTGVVTGGWMPPDSQAGYVMLFGRKDATGRVQLGAPSGRTVVSNGADVTLPAGSILQNPALALFPDDAGINFGTSPHTFKLGDAFLLTTAAADSATFPGGTYTVLGGPHTTPTSTGIGYTNPGTAAALTSNTQPCTISHGYQKTVVTFSVPSVIDDTYFFRIYRTVSTETAAVDPGDEYFLVYEAPISAADKTLGYVEWTDTTPDDYLIDPLYTNPRTGEAVDSPLDKDNNRPPLAADLCLWKERMWYAQCTNRHTLEIQILGAGSPNGIQAGDTIAVGGTTFTCTTAVSASTNFNAAVPGSKGLAFSATAAQQVEYVAQELVIAINNTNLSRVNARYISGPNDPPGKILLEERAINGAAFSVTTSRPSALSPTLPTIGGAATKLNTSVNDAAPHRIFYSKQGQPDAVGGLAFFDIGAKDKKILRIKALMDRLFVFKEDGIWTISNDYPFRVVPLDTTAILLAPDSVETVNNSIMALTSQGVVQVSASGVAIISTPIEADIKRLYGYMLPALKRYSFGISYESARKYILALPTEGSDTTCTQQYVYDVGTQAWTRWTRDTSCGGVNPYSDFLYLSDSASNKLSVERKSYTRDDYADEGIPVTITSVSGKTVTVSSTTGVTAGDMLYQNASAHALVDTVVSSTQVTVNSTVTTWTTGGAAANFYPAIDCQVMYNPQFGGKPSYAKHFREVTFHLRSPGISYASGVFTSDLNTAELTVPLPVTGYGLQAWGQFNWAMPAGARNNRMGVPLQHARASTLSVGFRVRESGATWALHGFSIEDESMSERNSK